jgi:hypothetical protein
MLWKCIRKSQTETCNNWKSQTTKSTEVNGIPVNYYKKKGAWMDREVLENWFHKHFVPKVWA